MYNSGTINTVGSLPPFSEIRSIAVAQGRFYNDEDNAEARNVAFLGSDTKKQLFADREALGADHLDERQTLHRHRGNEIQRTELQLRRHRHSKNFHSVQRHAPRFSQQASSPSNIPWTACWSRHGPSKRIRTASRQLRRSLGRLHNYDPRDKEAASIWDTVKGAEANRMIIVGMEMFMGAVGIATLFLGGLSVMNVMLVSVRERTREIGVRMALGATRNSILRQFFLETIFVVGTQRGRRPVSFLRILRARESPADAAVFYRHAH